MLRLMPTLAAAAVRVMPRASSSFSFDETPALAFTPDGNRLAWDSRLWDWKQTKDSVHFGNPGRTASSIFAASGRVLLTTPADRNLRDRLYVWDVASRQLRSILSL